MEHQTHTLAERALRLNARAETGPLAKLNARCAELEAKLAERQTTLQKIDLTQLMPAPSACWARVFERDLEKDQITPALAAQAQV